jgi:hypothetical protein
MASKAVRTALEAKLALLAPANSTIPFKDTLNTAQQDGADAAYVVIEYPTSSPELRLTFGNPGRDLWRETGMARLICRVPRGEGTGTALDPINFLDTIADGLRGLNLDGVRIESVGQTDTSLSDDQHFRAMLTVGFKFYRCG